MTPQERKAAVEWHLKNWRRLQEEVWAAERDAANIAFSQGSGEPVQSSSISDKTARGAFVLESIADKKAWVDCVTEAMAWLEHEQPDLQRLLYGHYGMYHTRGYKRGQARAFADSYCKVYHIAMSEYHNRRIDALDEVVLTATEHGLLHSSNEQRKAVL